MEKLQRRNLFVKKKCFLTFNIVKFLSECQTLTPNTSHKLYKGITDIEDKDIRLI